MRILDCELKDALVMEIGRFSILWNSFERIYCDNNCNPAKLRQIAREIRIDDERAGELARALNGRRDWFEQTAEEYVETGLHPGNARNSKAEDRILMERYLNGESDDWQCGCLLVICRIRNNLMHGLKHIEELNDQLPLFVAVNGVLESMA